MDERYRKLSPAEEAERRKKAVEEILAHPEWTVPEAIKYMKRCLHLKAKDVAALSGVGHRTVANIESGATEGTVVTVNSILSILGLKLGVVKDVPPDSSR